MANTPPSGTEFAIPNLSNTTNTLFYGGEPGIWKSVATGQSNSVMNGTYTTIGSHFFSGDSTFYSPVNCFSQNGVPLLSSNNIHYYGKYWESRSGSNNYNVSGAYTGSTNTGVKINGVVTSVLGEYVTITAPYRFVLRAYSLISSNFNGVSTPASGWVIAGSNDGGDTYTLVDSVTSHPLPLAGYEVFTISNNNTSYSTYTIIITTITNGNGAANIATWNLYSPTASSNQVCFLENTKILCQKGVTEEYVPIQQLRVGDLVKTPHGLVPITMIGNSYMTHDKIKFETCLYRLVMSDYPELTEDIIMTGRHGILQKEISELEMERMKIVCPSHCNINGMYRLLMYLNTKAIMYEKEGIYNIWNIVLKNDDIFAMDEIYANGLLVESCSAYFMKVSNMTIME